MVVQRRPGEEPYHRSRFYTARVISGHELDCGPEIACYEELKLRLRPSVAAVGALAIAYWYLFLFSARLVRFAAVALGRSPLPAKEFLTCQA